MKDKGTFIASFIAKKIFTSVVPTPMPLSYSAIKDKRYAPPLFGGQGVHVHVCQHPKEFYMNFARVLDVMRVFPNLFIHKMPYEYQYDSDSVIHGPVR